MPATDVTGRLNEDTDRAHPQDADAAPADAGEEIGGAGSASAAAAAAAAAVKDPVLYMRLDPEQDWLCGVSVQQDQTMWATQLEKSREVVGQSLAVAGARWWAVTGCSRTRRCGRRSWRSRARWWGSHWL